MPIRAGERYDRYGDAIGAYSGSGIPTLGGNFTSPMPDGISYSFGKRALNKAEIDYDFKFEIEVLKDLPFSKQDADVIPWFGMEGKGKQSMWNIPIDNQNGFMITWNKLSDLGFVKITIKKSKYPSVLINTVIP